MDTAHANTLPRGFKSVTVLADGIVWDAESCEDLPKSKSYTFDRDFLKGMDLATPFKGGYSLDMDGLRDEVAESLAEAYGYRIRRLHIRVKRRQKKTP